MHITEDMQHRREDPKGQNCGFNHLTLHETMLTLCLLMPVRFYITAFPWTLATVTGK